jgi:mono/diheme cytochrome c family protein
MALVIVVGLSFVFASRHNAVVEPILAENPPPSPHAFQVESGPGSDVLPSTGSFAKLAAVPQAENVVRGAAAYGRNSCATCHSIGGEGNPRYPLDGCGDRWDADELSAWITGTGVAAEVLSEGMRRRKSRYKNLPPDDLSAIVLYLTTLRKSEH